jgi:hypothetical protein
LSAFQEQDMGFGTGDKVAAFQCNLAQGELCRTSYAIFCLLFSVMEEPD